LSVRERLESLYEEKFRSLNREFKQIATDWQMRRIGERLEINDHRDLEYDFSVLNRLDGLHEGVKAMKDKLVSILPECEGFFDRLERAKEKLDSSDNRFFTGTDVDSYHAVWFEMHDYVLRKLGKERAEDEV